MLCIEHSLLSHLASETGLEVLGYCDTVAPTSDAQALQHWQNTQYYGEMGYMARSAELLCEPKKLLAESTGLAVFVVHYDRTPSAPLRTGFGKVARYAWGRDYHSVLKERLLKLLNRLQVEVGDAIRYRVFSDAVPLLERAFARKAGLGFIGKNTLLITPKAGSFSFIAEVLWNVSVKAPPLRIVKSHCGTCSSCIKHCPTGALVAPYQLDARRCISYLNIEKKGALEYWERSALGEWVFGCDRCQEVCPFNHSALKQGESAALPEFSAEAGVGPSLDLSKLLGIRTQGEFKRRFGATALLRGGRESLLRNAAVVASNTLAECLLDALKEAIESDSSEVVRSHALWAYSSINAMRGGSNSQTTLLMNKALRDPSPLVVREAESILENA